MLYTVEAMATNVEPDSEALADVYDALAAMPGIEAPSISADTVDNVVRVRADVEAPTRVDADRILVQAFGSTLQRLIAGNRVSYVMPALAGE